MTRYVVTGGAGFIGSALVRALLARGDVQVRVVDNLLTGHESNLAEVCSQIEWDRSDIRDASATLSAIRGADVVFHLAAIPSVPRSIQDPVPSHEVNIDGTFNVLRASVDAKVRRVVYAASSSAYGDTEVLPKVESHAAASQVSLRRAKAGGRVLRQRVPLLLWPGNRRAALLQRLWRTAGSFQSILGRPLAVYESPDRALARPPSSATANRRAISPTSKTSRPVLKAAMARQTSRAKCTTPETATATHSITSGICCRKSRAISLAPNYGPPRQGDVRDSQADTTAARRDLGHVPSIRLKKACAARWPGTAQ